MSKIKLITFFFLSILPFQSWAGDPLCLNGSTGEAIVWPLDEPIPYYVDPDVLGKLSQEQATQLIQHVIQVWEDVSIASVQFEFKGYLDQDVNKETYTIVYDEFDEYKEDEPGIYIIFDNDGTFDEEIWDGLSAVAVTKTVGLNAFWDERDPITNYQRMLIIFDARWIDGLEEPKRELSVLEITNTLIHELGHALGIEHAETNFSNYYYTYYYSPQTYFIYSPTMNGLGSDEKGYMSTLNPDDLAIISRLYPTETSETETGKIYGTVTLPDGTPISKLQVIARNINDPLCESFVTHTSYYCTPRITTCEIDNYVIKDCEDEAKEGDFQFTNLPPGDYIIEVDEIYSYYSFELSPYYHPSEIPGGAELWNEGDAADESPYLYTTISVEAGEAVEGINVVLRSSEVNIDDATYLERIPYTFYEENGMPSLPEEESRCKSNNIDYAALIGVDESSGTSTGETTGGEQNVTTSSGGGGCSLLNTIN